jgi:hypothetical protein
VLSTVANTEVAIIQKKSTSIIVYILFALFSAVIYGLFAFFVIYRGLAGEEILSAYLWNIAFIIIFLIFDKIANDVLHSEEFVITKRNFPIAMLTHTISFISFKTTLYLFYTFILIVSRVSLLAPETFNNTFQSFVLSIEYCLILLVAFDKFIEHLMKDDRRIKRITAKFTKFVDFVTTKRNKKNI